MTCERANDTALSDRDRIMQVEEDMNDLRRLATSMLVVWQRFAEGQKTGDLGEVIEADLYQARHLSSSICRTLYGPVGAA